LDRLTVLVACLRQEEKQRQAQISPLLNFNRTRADRHLDNLSNDLGAYLKGVVRGHIFKCTRRSVQKVDSLEHCGEELLHEDAVKAHLSFLPFCQHVEKQSQHALEVLETFRDVLSISHGRPLLVYLLKLEHFFVQG